MKFMLGNLVIGNIGKMKLASESMQNNGSESDMLIIMSLMIIVPVLVYIGHGIYVKHMKK